MVSLSGTAYAVISFNQNFPNLQVKGIINNCKDLTSNRAGVLPPPTGLTFSVFFDCSPTDFSTVPAFSVTSQTAMMASYGLPNGYSGCHGVDGMSKITVGPVMSFPNRICIYPAGQEAAPCTSANDDCVGNTTCDANSANSGLYMVAIPPSLPQTFSSFQNWNYCLEYTSTTVNNAGPNLGPISIVWTT